MNNLTSVFFLLFFVYILNAFLEFFKVDSYLPERKRKEIMGLAKTCLGKYKPYNTYLHIICYTKQQFSFLTQSKTEIYVMSFTNIQRKSITKLELRLCGN